MRSSFLLLAASALCSANSPGCSQHPFEELITRTSCGDEKSIFQCLASDIDLKNLDEIRQCFVMGDCSESDAATEAARFALEYRAEVREGDDKLELRRRADSTDSSAASATTDSDDTTTATTSEQSTETSQSTAAATSSTIASTTSDSTTDSTTASTSSSSVASSASATTSSISSSSSSSSTSSGSSTSGGVLTGTVCSTTQIISTSACATSAGTSTCSAIQVSTAACAPGHLCTTNSASENVCMSIDNTVGVVGIIIAIVFGTSILAVALGIFILNSKSNRAAKSQAEKEALLSGYPGKGSGRAADLEAYKPQTSQSNLPLIVGPERQAPNSRRTPQLQSGLGALS